MPASRKSAASPPAASHLAVLIALLRAAGRVRMRVATVIEPHGITGPQYNVLRILRGAGPDGLPTLTVSDRLMERSPGITRMMDRLEAKRLVVRERGSAGDADGGSQRCAAWGSDRRCVCCRITAAGLELLARLDGPVAEANRAAFPAWTEANMTRLAADLRRVCPEEEP